MSSTLNLSLTDELRAFIDAHCGDAEVCTTALCDPVLDCQYEAIEACDAALPATSEWGLTAIGLLLLALGCLLLRRPGSSA